MPHNPRPMDNAKTSPRVELELLLLRICSSVAYPLCQWASLILPLLLGPALFPRVLLGQDSLGHESKVQLASASSVKTVPSLATSSDRVSTSRWPHVNRVGQFHVHSTIPIAKLDKHLLYLSTLPKELTNSLAIPISEQPVHLVVLESRESLDDYVKRLLPNAL